MAAKKTKKSTKKTTGSKKGGAKKGGAKKKSGSKKVRVPTAKAVLSKAKEIVGELLTGAARGAVRGAAEAGTEAAATGKKVVKAAGGGKSKKR